MNKGVVIGGIVLVLITVGYVFFTQGGETGGKFVGIGEKDCQDKCARDYKLGLGAFAGSLSCDETDKTASDKYYSKGTTTSTWTYLSGISEIRDELTDICESNGKTLSEYSCNLDGTIASESYNCPYKCDDGSCILFTEPNIFVSSQLYSADLKSEAQSAGCSSADCDTGLRGADYLCNNLAETSKFSNILEGAWTAILSDSATAAKDRLPDIAFKDMGGTTIATSKSDLFDGISNAISLDETGNTPQTTVISDIVWTGSQSDGTPLFSTPTCGDWTTATSVESQGFGRFLSTGDGWINKHVLNCGSSYKARLYCVKQPTPPAGSIFVSSQLYSADLKSEAQSAGCSSADCDTGLRGADYLCNNLAETSSLSGSWTAIVSTSIEDAADRVPDKDSKGNTLIFKNVMGNTIANSKSDLLADSGSTPLKINYDETRRKVADGTSVWTGSLSDGTAHSGICSDWSSTVPSDIVGEIGSSRQGGWLFAVKSELCADKLRLYCLKQPNAPAGSIFVSSKKYWGNFKADAQSAGCTNCDTGLKGADYICSNLANKAKLGGSWTALLSDSANDAIDRIPDYSYKDLRGNAIASSRSALFGSNVDKNINIDERRSKVSAGERVFSGTYSSGSRSSNNCQDWGPSCGSATVGVVGGSGNHWIAKLSSSPPARIYCVKDPVSRCSDTDTSLGNPDPHYAEGTATATWEYPDGTKGQRAQATDSCQSDGKTLNEQRCAYDIQSGNSNVETEVFTCPYRCEENRCKDPRGFSSAGTTFVSSQLYSGDLKSAAQSAGCTNCDTGLKGADYMCKSLADTAGLSGKWTALLSDRTKSMKDRIPDTKYHDIYGNVLANDKADLLDGVGDVKINSDESGGRVTAGSYVWSGSQSDGTSFSDPFQNNYICQDWEVSNSDYSFIGEVDASGGNWIRSNVNTCAGDAHIYCVQQPEPPIGSIFVSSKTYTGDLKSAAQSAGCTNCATGLKGADYLCNNLVSSAGWTTSGWSALISTSTKNAFDRIPSTYISGESEITIIFRDMNGNIVAGDKSDLFDGVGTVNINIDETLSTVSVASNVWTGTLSDGTKAINNCNNWDAGSAATSSVRGKVGGSGDVWIGGGARSCNNQGRLYCVQTEVPIVKTVSKKKTRTMLDRCLTQCVYNIFQIREVIIAPEGAEGQVSGGLPVDVQLPEGGFGDEVSDSPPEEESQAPGFIEGPQE